MLSLKEKKTHPKDCSIRQVIKILKNGGIGIIPTDTIYGLVGSAYSKEAIKRIYKIKNRDKKKKSIILISSIADLKKFNIKLTSIQKLVLGKYWPGKVSIILNGIAFRLPAKKSLIEILKKTGPLVAPSANIEGLPPAKNIKQAKEYFGNIVDFYLSGGTLESEPSTLIEVNKYGSVKVLRGIINIRL